MAIFSLAIVSLLSYLIYTQFDTALKERILLQLASVKKLKVLQIQREIKERIQIVDELVDSYNEEEFEGYYLESFNIIEKKSFAPIIKLDKYQIKTDTMIRSVKIIDLTPQHPEGVITLAFISPYKDKVLICIDEMPEIQQILLERTGLGQTGESYLVGNDYRMRTISRFFPDRNPTKIEAKTEGVLNALMGNDGESLIRDYRGLEVFSAYQTIKINGLQWIILSEMDRQEALFPLKSLRNQLIIFLAIIFILIVAGSYILAQWLVTPVVTMEEKLNNLAKGAIDDLEINPRRSDEIGQMFVALSKLVSALDQTAKFALEIGKGNFEAEYHLLSEQDKMGTSLLSMKNQLKIYKENEAKLLKENRRAIIEGQENERSRLAKEIHDGLGPLLTSMRIKIQSQEWHDETKEQLLGILDETINEIRRVSNNLMPSVLTDFGAGEAIGNLTRQIEKNTGIAIRYKNDMTAESNTSTTVHIALYRIAQEAINNVIKHANATQIKLSVSEFEDLISLYISDNGSGFDPDAVKDGNGLKNMTERVKLVEGSLNLESDKYGTTLEVEIPLK